NVCAQIVEFRPLIADYHTHVNMISEPPTNVSSRATSSILSTISRGKRPRHIFALIYGVDGVGKSVWASHSPRPIFIGAEHGTDQVDGSRFPPIESIGELLAQVRAVQTEKHEFD